MAFIESSGCKQSSLYISPNSLNPGKYFGAKPAPFRHAMGWNSAPDLTCADFIEMNQ